MSEIRSRARIDNVVTKLHSTKPNGGEWRLADQQPILNKFNSFNIVYKHADDNVPPPRDE